MARAGAPRATRSPRRPEARPGLAARAARARPGSRTRYCDGLLVQTIVVPVKVGDRVLGRAGGRDRADREQRRPSRTWSIAARARRRWSRTAVGRPSGDRHRRGPSLVGSPLLPAQTGALDRQQRWAGQADARDTFAAMAPLTDAGGQVTAASRGGSARPGCPSSRRRAALVHRGDGAGRAGLAAAGAAGGAAGDQPLRRLAQAASRHAEGAAWMSRSPSRAMARSRSSATALKAMAEG